MAISVAELLQQLEEISRSRADRVLRLRGSLPVAEAWEPFELLIFRGFSSSVSHPTDFDPDQPLLPEAARIEQAELLQGPLNPQAEQCLASTSGGEGFLDPSAWL